VLQRELKPGHLRPWSQTSPLGHSFWVFCFSKVLSPWLQEAKVGFSWLQETKVAQITCLGSHNKLPQTGLLKAVEMSSLTVTMPQVQSQGL
jgi:hypothetical protein